MVLKHRELMAPESPYCAMFLRGTGAGSVPLPARSLHARSLRVERRNLARPSSKASSDRI